MNDINQYFNDLYPIIAKRYENDVKIAEKLVNTLISVEDTDTYDYRIDGMGGYGEIPKYDGTTISQIGQKRGYTTIVTPEERAAKVPVTLKYSKVDQSGEAKKVAQRLGISMKATIINDFYRMFQRAYDSNYAGGDGLAWAATNHRVTSDTSVSDTFSNLITNTLGTNGLDTAIKLANRYVTTDGLPLNAKYDLVLVSPELENKARELFGPSRQLTPEKMPESAENGANPYYDLMYYVVGGGSLGFTAKQWALASSEMLKMTAALVYITRPMVKPMAETPFVMNYYPYADYNLGWAEPRALVFSNPT